MTAHRRTAAAVVAPSVADPVSIATQAVERCHAALDALPGGDQDGTWKLLSGVVERSSAGLLTMTQLVDRSTPERCDVVDDLAIGLALRHAVTNPRHAGPSTDTYTPMGTLDILLGNREPASCERLGWVADAIAPLQETGNLPQMRILAQTGSGIQVDDALQRWLQEEPRTSPYWEQRHQDAFVIGSRIAGRAWYPAYAESIEAHLDGHLRSTEPAVADGLRLGLGSPDDRVLRFHACPQMTRVADGGPWRGGVPERTLQWMQAISRRDTQRPWLQRHTEIVEHLVTLLTHEDRSWSAAAAGLLAAMGDR